MATDTGRSSTGARVRYRYGERSDKTGRFAGEQVQWAIPTGHPVYEPGSGAGMVLVPNDGGFVWLDSGSIVPAEFCRPSTDDARRHPDRPPFDGVPWASLSRDERALVAEWHTSAAARSQT